MNECFSEFKDKHKGQSAICFGTGQTLNKYEDKYNVVKCGSNEIIYKDYKMDYYFLGDPGSVKRGYLSDPESYDEYKPNIAKFYRKDGTKGYRGIKSKCENAIRYEIDGQRNGGKFNKDISEGMYAFATISLECMQFLLYTGIKRIYLVGHDCNYNTGSFKSPDFRMKNQHILSAWQKLNGFLELEYPDVEVYSINPVSLKVFKVCEFEDIKQNKENLCVAQ
jgi:hypothetical protein